MTKKPTKQCEACCDAKSDASRADYNKLLRKIRRGDRTQGHAREASAAAYVGYNEPHSDEYPSYGQPCWQQAMAEMLAWLVLAAALDAYLSAERTLANGGYMPLPVYQQIMSNYTAAMADYNGKWFTLETCLHGTPV